MNSLMADLRFYSFSTVCQPDRADERMIMNVVCSEPCLWFKNTFSHLVGIKLGSLAK